MFWRYSGTEWGYSCGIKPLKTHRICSQYWKSIPHSSKIIYAYKQPHKMIRRDSLSPANGYTWTIHIKSASYLWCACNHSFSLNPPPFSRHRSYIVVWYTFTKWNASTDDLAKHLIAGGKWKIGSNNEARRDASTKKSEKKLKNVEREIFSHGELYIFCWRMRLILFCLKGWRMCVALRTPIRSYVASMKR